MGNAYWYIKIKLSFFLFETQFTSSNVHKFFITADSRTIKMHFEFEFACSTYCIQNIRYLHRLTLNWYQMSTRKIKRTHDLAKIQNRFYILRIRS